MKNLLLSLGLLLISTVVFAQNTDNPLPDAVKKQIEILKSSDLKLSEVQLSRIASGLIANNERVEKSKAALEGQSGNVLNERLILLKNNMVKSIKGALTPLQIQKFDQAKLADKL